MTKTQLIRRIRTWIVFFMVMLILSGITASPVLAELDFALAHRDWFPDLLQQWLDKTANALKEIGQRSPYVFYAFDWLAFAHVVIALFFIGVYRDPAANAWVLDTGMIACLAVFPLAFIAGEIRGIPWFWRWIDCSFGVFGILPLLYLRRLVRQLKTTPV